MRQILLLILLFFSVPNIYCQIDSNSMNRTDSVTIFWNNQLENYYYKCLDSIISDLNQCDSLSRFIKENGCLNLDIALLLAGMKPFKKESHIFLAKISKYYFDKGEPIILVRLGYNSESLNHILENQKKQGVIFVPAIYASGCIGGPKCYEDAVDYFNNITYKLIDK
jgi:hypothetical protein